MLATRQGRIKRVPLGDFSAVRSNGLIAMSLGEGDTLSWVRMTTGDQDVIIVTENGMSIRFHESDVRVMGRPASGVNAIRLHRGDSVAGMDVIEDEDTDLLIVTDNAYGKRTELNEYTRQVRYGRGVRTLARNDRTGPIVAARCINPEDDIALITTAGMSLRTQLQTIRPTGRSTQGVQLMHLAEADSVVSIAIVEGRRQLHGSENGDTDDRVDLPPENEAAAFDNSLPD